MLQFLGLCDTHDGLAAALGSQYGETPIAVGLAGTAYIMELFANRETGTWTFVLTRADGSACGLASGDGLETLAPPKEGA